MNRYEQWLKTSGCLPLPQDVGPHLVSGEIYVVDMLPAGTHIFSKIPNRGLLVITDEDPAVVFPRGLYNMRSSVVVRSVGDNHPYTVSRNSKYRVVTL